METNTGEIQPRKRILFVDDEEPVLEGLRRALRGVRTRWDMIFTSDPDQARHFLRQGGFDALICDLRMPGASGLELFKEALSLCPETFRVAFSGYSDLTLVSQSTKLVHQFIAKPSPPGALTKAIERALELKEKLREPFFAKMTASLTSLPPLPELYVQVLDLLRSQKASIEKIGALISRDMAMTAKLLQLVNSAFFGLRYQVTDPARAVALLGVERTRSVVCSLHIFGAFEALESPDLSLSALWDHSLKVASLSQALGRAEKSTGEVESCFTAGLLHDVGKLIFSCFAPEAYKHIVRGSERGIPAHHLEEAACGTTHAELGGYLLGLWGLPEEVTEAVLYHHKVPQAHRDTFSAATAVHTADALQHKLAGASKEFVSQLIDRCVVERFGGPKRLAEWEVVAAALIGAKEKRPCP